MAEYVALTEEARRSGAKIFFADEAHSRADAELRGKWVLKGEPALVDSTSPRRGEKASCYSAVCLETGEVEWMELEGNSNSGTSAAFLMQLPDATEGKILRAAEGDLGQLTGPPRRGGARVPGSAGPRSLAGKPSAGFCATPSRRIPVLYGPVVHVRRCNTYRFIDNRR